MVSQVFSENGVAIKGYDPVAYMTENAAVKGTEIHNYNWREVTWYFSSAENQRLFMEDPQKYVPQYGGHCAFAMSLGKLVPGSPAAWAIKDGKIYFNLNGFAKFLWNIIPGRIEAGQEKWSRL
ncbi:MAG: hypothetical protein MJA83_04235 [Gammaproteobacteria bacterium]|nr:hypothetical protein [Gammaproteobacteria bacterium]